MFVIYLAIAVTISGVPAFPQNGGNNVNQNDNVNPMSPVDGFIFNGPINGIPSWPFASGPRNPQQTQNTIRTSESDDFSNPLIISTTTRQNLNEPQGFNDCYTSCPVTPEYNPVCGTDNTIYPNPGNLNCAARCGRNVLLSHYGPCATGNLRG